MAGGRNRRRLAIAASFAVLTAGALFSVWNFIGRPAAETALRGRLERDGSRLLQRPVHVERVRIHPLLVSATFEHLRVDSSDGAPLFGCDRWVVQMTPFNFRRTYPWFAFAIGNSVVEKPVFHLTAAGASQAPPDFGALFKSLSRRPAWLAHQLAWRDGKLYPPAVKGVALPGLQNFAGSLRVDPRGLTLDSHADSPWGTAAVSAELSNAGAWKAAAAAERVPLEKVAQWSPALAERLSGETGLRATARGRWIGGDPLAENDWDVSAVVKDGAWTFAEEGPSGPARLPFAGTLELNAERLLLKNVRVWNRIAVSGACRTPFSRPDLNVTVKAEDLALDSLRERLPAAWFYGVDFRGRADAEARVTGSPSAPEISARGTVNDAAVGPVKVPSVEADFRYGGGDFALNAALLNGKLSITRTARGGPEPAALDGEPVYGPAEQQPAGTAWNVRVENFDVSRLSRANQWGRIGGVLTSQFRFRAGAAAPVPPATDGAGATPMWADGYLRLDRFSWGVHKETAPVYGRLSFQKGQLVVQGPKEVFHAAARYSRGKLTVSDFAFELPSGLAISAAGSLDTATNKVALRGSLDHVPVRDVPMLLERFPNISGELNFDGSLTGTLRSPFFEGKGAVAALRLQADGPAQDAQASIRWNPYGLAISSASVGSSLKGEARWFAGGGWSMTVEADGADAALVNQLFPKADPLGGKVTGRARIVSRAKAPPGAWDGEAEVSWADGRWRDVAFEDAHGRFKFEDGSVRFTDLDVRQSSGALHAEGVAPLTRGPGTFAFLAQFRHFSYRSVWLDGEAAVKAAAAWRPVRFAGELRSPNFWINGYGVGAIDGRFEMSPERLTIESFRAGDLARGTAVVDFAKRTLSGEASWNGVPLRDWAPRFGLNRPVFASGQTAGAVTFGGPWDAPRAEVTAKWTDGSLNGVGFDASIKGRWADGALHVDDLSAALEQQGKIRGSGTLSFAASTSAAAGTTPSSPQADFAFDLSGIPVNQCLALTGWRPGWSGTFDGRIAWQGPLDDPMVIGSLSGREVRADKLLVASWTGAVRYRNREVTIDEFYAKTPEGIWRLKPGSRLFLTGEGRGHLQLISELRNIHMGPLSFFGGLEVVGQWDANHPASIDCQLKAQSLWVNQHRFDQDLARVRWSGRDIVFTPVPGAIQQLSGTVHLEEWPQVRLEDLALTEDNTRKFLFRGEVGPDKWDFTLEGDDLESGTLISLADMDLPMEGLLDVKLTGRGSPQKPRVQGDIVSEKGSAGGLPYDKFSAHVDWDGPYLRISGLEASRRGRYLLRGEGRFPVAADQTTDNDYVFSLRLTNGDLSILKEIWPECKSAAGAFRGELSFKPRGDGVSADGYLIVENGRIHASKYFHDISDLNARILVKGNKLVFENCSGRVGRGRLLVQGKLGIDGFDITEYDLSVESVGKPGIDIEVPQLSVPPGPLLRRFSLLRASLENTSRGQPLVYLRVRGPDGEQVVEGNVILEGTQFTYPPPKDGFAGLRKDSWMWEFWDDTNWDVTLRTGENTWYRNEYVDVQVKGEMQLFGTRRDMHASGRIESDRGVINYLGQSFNVRDAMFEVVTDTRAVAADRATIPYLAGRAERASVLPDARGVPTPDTVTMIVRRAPVGELQPEFISRNYPEWKSELVARKTLGITDESYPLLARDQQKDPKEAQRDQQDQLLRAGVVQLLGSTTGPLANRIAHRFGIDILYPFYEAPDTESAIPNQPRTQRRDLATFLRGTGYTLGTQLNNRVFGMYKFTVDQTQNQLYFRDELELVYRIGGNLHLRASTELDTEKLLGQPPNRQAVLENRWRFGKPRKKASKEEARQPSSAPQPATR